MPRNLNNLPMNKMGWSVKISRRKVISVGQMKLLVSYLERHKDLALGCVRSKEGRALSKRLWVEIANILNAEKTGCHKSAREWNKFYNDYKCRLKSKVRRLCQSLNETGGGSQEDPPCPPLTPLEERLCAVIGGLPTPHNPDDESEDEPVHFREEPLHFSEAPEVPQIEHYEELSAPADRRIKVEYNPPSPKQVKETDLETTLINIENENLKAKKTMIEVEKNKVLAIQSLANAVWAVANALQSPNKKTKKRKKKSDNDSDSDDDGNID